MRPVLTTLMWLSVAVYLSIATGWAPVSWTIPLLAGSLIAGGTAWIIRGLLDYRRDELICAAMDRHPAGKGQVQTVHTPRPTLTVIDGSGE